MIKALKTWLETRSIERETKHISEVRQETNFVSFNEVLEYFNENINFLSDDEKEEVCRWWGPSNHNCDYLLERLKRWVEPRRKSLDTLGLGDYK